MSDKLNNIKNKNNKIYDLLILGAGSAGLPSAKLAAQMNKSVLLFEYGPIGGTCVNVGCVPKKITYEMACALDDMEKYKKYINNDDLSRIDKKYINNDLEQNNLEINYNKFVSDRAKAVHRLNGIYQGQIDRAGIEIIWGKAELLDTDLDNDKNDLDNKNNILDNNNEDIAIKDLNNLHKVKCNGVTYYGKYVLIATGSKPNEPKDIQIIDLEQNEDRDIDTVNAHKQPNNINNIKKIKNNSINAHKQTSNIRD